MVTVAAAAPAPAKSDAGSGSDDESVAKSVNSRTSRRPPAVVTTKQPPAAAAPPAIVLRQTSITTPLSPHINITSPETRSLDAAESQDGRQRSVTCGELGETDFESPPVTPSGGPALKEPMSAQLPVRRSQLGSGPPARLGGSPQLATQRRVSDGAPPSPATKPRAPRKPGQPLHAANGLELPAGSFMGSPPTGRRPREYTDGSADGPLKPGAAASASALAEPYTPSTGDRGIEGSASRRETLDSIGSREYRATLDSVDSPPSLDDLIYGSSKHRPGSDRGTVDSAYRGTVDSALFDSTFDASSDRATLDDRASTDQGPLSADMGATQPLPASAASASALASVKLARPARDADVDDAPKKSPAAAGAAAAPPANKGIPSPPGRPGDLSPASPHSSASGSVPGAPFFSGSPPTPSSRNRKSSLTERISRGFGFTAGVKRRRPSGDRKSDADSRSPPTSPQRSAAMQEARNASVLKAHPGGEGSVSAVITRDEAGNDAAISYVERARALAARAMGAKGGSPPQGAASLRIEETAASAAAADQFGAAASSAPKASSRSPKGGKKVMRKQNTMSPNAGGSPRTLEKKKFIANSANLRSQKASSRTSMDRIRQRTSDALARMTGGSAGGKNGRLSPRQGGKAGGESQKDDGVWAKKFEELGPKYAAFAPALVIRHLETVHASTILTNTKTRKKLLRPTMDDSSLATIMSAGTVASDDDASPPAPVPELDPLQAVLTPAVEPFWGILFFIDISGFTRLSQKFGAEKMKEIASNYFTEMIEIIGKHHGDVVKFLGDAMFVVWPVSCDAPTPVKQYLAYLAVKTAQEVMEKLGKWVKGEGDEQVVLTLHCGLAASKMNGFLVGVNDRWEYLIAGDALAQVAGTEHEAKKGEVVMSPAVEKLVNSIAYVVERAAAATTATRSTTRRLLPPTTSTAYHHNYNYY